MRRLPYENKYTFKCPKCRGFHFGTKNHSLPAEQWIRYCAGCNFEWPTTDDIKYWTHPDPVYALKVRAAKHRKSYKNIEAAHLRERVLYNSMLEELAKDIQELHRDYTPHKDISVESIIEQVRTQCMKAMTDQEVATDPAKIPKEDFTCHTCTSVDTCDYAWDLYNTQGDCLGEK